MTLSRFWNWQSIRFRLACLVLACVVPVWLAAGTVITLAYRDKKANVEARLLETAQNLRLAMEQELELIQAALGALATSPALDAGDFAAFHRQAKQLLAVYPGGDILLADATGHQIINSYRPPGTPLPKRGAENAVRRIFEGGKPIVSGLFKGSITGRHLISVDVPVLRDGKVIYDLAMALPTDRLVAILDDHPLPQGWIGLIVDHNDVAVYRTQQADRFVGQGLSSFLAATDEGGRVVEMVNLDGVASLASLSRSAETGWAVVVHVPAMQMWAQLRNWLVWTVTGMSLLSVIGVGLAFVLARGISRSIRALIVPAGELAAGRLAGPGQYDLGETAAVGRALDEASRLLTERTANLERSNQELEEFAAVASHDLQEPLRKIKAFGERLRENNADNLDETGRDYLCRMEKAVERMDALILGLLEYSRITTRPNPFVMTDLGQLVREAVSDIDAALRETGGHIEVETLPEAAVDLLQMRRAFQNLLSNALKFHGDDPPRITVSGSLENRNGQMFAKVEVRDNGIGFEEKYLEKIFQPFQRLHGRGRFPGTGIGLAIVKKSVERHGGTVTATSRLGDGAVFCITIPVHQQPRGNDHDAG